MNNIQELIAVYVCDESDNNVRKLINYLEKGHFNFYFNTNAMRHYCYIIVETKYKVARGTIHYDFRPQGKYYFSKNAQYMVGGLMKIDEFLKREFKKKLVKNRKKCRQ